MSQIAGGALADRIGPKRVILWASVLGGLCTMASASAGSIEALYAAQVLLGVSQGPLYPTSVAFLSPWLPPTERSFASTVLDLGITVVSPHERPHPRGNREPTNADHQRRQAGTTTHS